MRAPRVSGGGSSGRQYPAPLADLPGPAPAWAAGMCRSGHLGHLWNPYIVYICPAVHRAQAPGRRGPQPAGQVSLPPQVHRLPPDLPHQAPWLRAHLQALVSVHSSKLWV